MTWWNRKNRQRTVIAERSPYWPPGDDFYGTAECYIAMRRAGTPPVHCIRFVWVFAQHRTPLELDKAIAFVPLRHAIDEHRTGNPFADIPMRAALGIILFAEEHWGDTADRNETVRTLADFARLKYEESERLFQQHMPR